jgi:AAHS family 4-hydroxybenzoate transporter-like MFS transporter
LITDLFYTSIRLKMAIDAIKAGCANSRNRTMIGEGVLLVARESGANLSIERDQATPLLVIVAFILVMIDGYDMFIVAFLVPLISADLNLAPISMGQIFAAGLAGSMLGGMVLGPVADRYGRRPVLTLSLAVAGAATILCSTATSFAELAAYRFVAGFALGGVLTAVIPLMAEHFPHERRNTAVTMMFVGFPSGAVVGGALTSMLIHHGWRTLFVGAGSLTLVLVPMAFLLKESLGRSDAGTGRPQIRMSSIRAVVAEGRLLATLFMDTGVFLMLLVAYLLNSWTPLIAVKSGMSPASAALCGVFLNLGGIIGALASTFVIKRYGLFRPVAAMIVIGALAIALIGQLYATSTMLFAGLFIAGLFAIGGQQNAPAMAVQLYPRQIRATGTGLQFAVGRLGSIAGPLIGGQLLTWQIAPQSLFIIVAIPTLLAAIAYAAVEWIRPK